MTAIILAAGYATRLYPLTQNFPKTLLPVAGRPILEYTLEKLAECQDIERIYIVTNRKFYKSFQDWLQDYRCRAGMNQPIEILNDGTSVNEDRLGSIGDLVYTIESRGIDDDILVICSDKMFEFSLSGFVDYFKQKGAPVNTGFDTGDVEIIKDRHGCLVLDGNNRIVEFQEKPAEPKSTIESVAFYIYPKEVIPLIKRYRDEGNNLDAPGFLAKWVATVMSMYAYLFTGECHDIGTLESYKDVDRLYSERRGCEY